MNIAVLYNKPTKRALASAYKDTEDDTADSAAEVVKALKVKGANVTLFSVDENHIDRIADIRADLLFNLIEWTGLDLPLSDRAFHIVESLRISYTGATRKNFMETSDKILMKKLLDNKELPTARWQVFENGDEPVRADFRYPVILKLALEHCSIGLSYDAVVSTADEIRPRARRRIRDFGEPVIAEEFIDGRELQVTALETENGLEVLPPAEIMYKTFGSESLLTYESRWDDTTADYKASHVVLAPLAPALQAAIENVTKRTFRELGFRDYARLDVRMRGNDVVILEANSNPGLSDSDEYGMTLSYKAVGWTFVDFVWKIVESVVRRSHHRA